MLLLNNDEVGQLLSFHEVIDAVEEAIRAYENNSAVVPKRMHIEKGENTLLCMPALGAEAFGTKLVAVVPGNARKNLPVTNGAMLLNHASTGIPLALMNASKLTALRTGALGAIGIKLTTPANEESVGVIGCGVQGVHQALFACVVRPIKDLFFFDEVSSKITESINLVRNHHPHVNLISCQSAEELATKTNIIVAATTSSTPVLPNDEKLLERKHFVSIGSYKPTMQELPDLVYQLAGELIIDSDFARVETGDIINPVSRGFVKEENVYSIGKLLTGQRKLDTVKTTAYKSAGMALFDLYVAHLMYEEAVKKNRGTQVEF